MVDTTQHEQAALAHAVAMAGAYIEGLGRTDLMTWSPVEFAALIKVIVAAFSDHLRERTDGTGEVTYR